MVKEGCSVSMFAEDRAVLESNEVSVVGLRLTALFKMELMLFLSHGRVYINERRFFFSECNRTRQSR